MAIIGKILNVSIIDKNTLVLEKNAQKGVKIDLLLLNNVDLSNIEKQIELGIDNVYNRLTIEIEYIKNKIENFNIVKITNKIKKLEE